MKNFALIGVAGFIAPRHLQAIKDTQNNLVAALDKFDSVGIMDSFFPEADFFTEFERFDRHLEKIRRQGTPLDYVSICSPNYLHDAHIRFALRHHADAICEKPLVLNPWNLDALSEIERETGRRVFTILQLRLHPAIIRLREEVQAQQTSGKQKVDLTYITSRGNWYHHSWKGDVAKSGGVATNIGIHFFDMLLWLYGKVKELRVDAMTDEKVSGFLSFEKADVNWMLSISAQDLPAEVRSAGKRTFRQLTVGGKSVEFSDGFTDLHTRSYKEILSGHGFGLEDARASIELVHQIRSFNAS